MSGYERAAADWYVEPPEATEALLRAETFSGLSWDPACGQCTIKKVMLAAGLHCVASDIVMRCDEYDDVGDFRGDLFPFRGIANIVSNPPYKLAQAFAERALTIATHKVAFLLPLTFLEGTKRGRWIETTPLARVHVFSWRISMPPGELLKAGTVKPSGGKKAFAWFVWEKGWLGPAQVRFLQKEAA